MWNFRTDKCWQLLKILKLCTRQNLPEVGYPAGRPVLLPCNAFSSMLVLYETACSRSLCTQPTPATCLLFHMVILWSKYLLLTYLANSQVSVFLYILPFAVPVLLRYSNDAFMNAILMCNYLSGSLVENSSSMFLEDRVSSVSVLCSQYSN